ncbi:MAG: pantoate--beta-alanine ligase [Ilumatobacter sp.]|nr:pantoate--beta-alanine ligase [Ilumatobacter sp.]
MDLFTAPAAMRAWSRGHRAAGRTLGVVPTMGALHDGHLALIEAARRRAEVVIVTIFVNPLQFNEATDFDAYPRPIDDDLATCETLGVDAVYAPTAASMYGEHFQTHVEPGGLAEPFEGAMRPGHFRGVATVVTKLFGATRPDVAAFGRKDYQQLAIVRRMSTDLDLGVEILGVPTVREPDGLALSSRNVRLSPEDRRAAVVLSQALAAGARAVANGERDAVSVEAGIRASIEAEPRARLEYVAVVDPDTLAPMSRVDAPAVALVAAWFGDVRLIDNIAIGPPTAGGSDHPAEQ